MSRCFAFPPPGYELKAGAWIIDFSTKEKYREKKHKKEKREHKEKRDKYGSKDKPKEKKDQKHKDRKKQKDSTKRRTSEDIKAESQAQGHSLSHIKEHGQKTDEAKDSNFKEELNKRTRDDEAENPMFGNFRISIQRKFDAVCSASEMEYKKCGKRSLASDSLVVPKPEMRKLGAKIMASSSFASARRRKDVFGISVQNVSINAKTEVYTMDSVLKMEMERDTATEMFQVPQSVEKDLLKKFEGKNKTQGKEAENRRLQQKSNHSVKKSVAEHNSMDSVLKMEMERDTATEMFQVPQSVEKDILKKFEGKNKTQGKEAEDRRLQQKSNHSVKKSVAEHNCMDSVLKMEMERDTATEKFQVPQSVEKDILKKFEGKNKTQGKEAEDRRLQQKSNHSMKKSVAEHNKLNNFGKKDQVKTLNNKPLAAHKDDVIGIAYSDNESTKKRKYLDTNGFLQENGWPCKIPRMTSSSSQSAVNGLLEKKERKINGTEIFHLPSFELKAPAPGSLNNKNSDVSLLVLPHPDSKYLSQVYTVPKMVELPEIDNQEWLFSGYDSLQKSKIELRTESADVLVLPYVVPF